MEFNIFRIYSAIDWTSYVARVCFLNLYRWALKTRNKLQVLRINFENTLPYNCFNKGIIS